MNYAITVITSICILLILNHEYFRSKEEKNEVNQAFKRYIWAALGYYTMDALWGIIYDLKRPPLLYINTVFYHLAMAMTVVLLCRYVTAYLKLNTGVGRLINGFGLAFGIYEVVLLIINHFVHIFFWVDSAGMYHAYKMRYVALYMQVFLCAWLAIQTGFAIRKAIGEMKKRYISIFLFCIEMTVAIVTQVLYPLLPLYSIGLVVGITIIHMFVKESEKQEQYKILLSMADIYYSMQVIDLVNDNIVEFNVSDEVREIFDNNRAVEALTQFMETITIEDDRENAFAFTDLTTLAERMRNRKTISSQFRGTDIGWFLAMFITIETEKDGKPTKVIYTTRIIDEEKKQEETLIYRSQTDELTGLYNRRAYEEDIYQMDDIPNEFIYIELDVNGLKAVNDTIGHVAGDEIIVGASECMKSVLGPYGKLYRTGGDEFVAIEFIREDELKLLLKEFDEAISNWSGELVDGLSISYGFVSKEECPNFSVSQFAIEADKRMYSAKALYYQKKGIDRRGPR